MVSIKLARLPDRQPVKIMIQISPALHHQLQQYAAAYEAAYGKAESITDLVPAMLTSFLESDREFVKNSRVSQGGR